MMNSIFLSYRRADVPGYVHQIEKGLSAVFGKNRIFHDVSDVPGGTKWREVIDDNLSRSCAVIVIIGQHWEEIWNRKSEFDYVRYELTSAKEKGARIFPVTLDGVMLSQDLDLGEFAWLNDCQFSDLHGGNRWEGDLKKLVDALLCLKELRRRPTYYGDVASFIKYHSTPFVGRESQNANLVEYVEKEGPGYMLLSGHGKTAFLCNLVNRCEAGEWKGSHCPDVVYFFVRVHSDKPIDFLKALNAQLLYLLGQHEDLPADLQFLKSLFRQLWSQAALKADHERPLLLIVDELDAMALGELTIKDLLPSELQPQVFVVVSSRSTPDPFEDVAIEHPFRRAEKMVLPTFNRENIQALLITFGAENTVAESLSSRMLKLTMGDPRFARPLCQQAALEGESELVCLEEQSHVDIDAYFRMQFKQFDELAESDLAWSIVGLLVVAHAALTVGQIAEALDKPKRSVRKAIDPIRRFLTDADSVELMAPQLRRIAAEEFSMREQQHSRLKLLNWCRSYEKRNWLEETPDYVLSYYAEHLLENDDRDTLYALISKQWMEIQFSRWGSWGPFVEDVVLTINAARTQEPPNVVAEVRGCLVQATLSSLASSVPPEVLGILALAGLGTTATELTHLLRGEQLRKAEAMIATAFLQFGQVEEARQVLTSTLVGANETELYDLVAPLARIGRLDEVLTAISECESKDGRGRILRHLVGELASASSANEAFEAIESVEDKTFQAELLRNAARSLTLADKHDYAVQAADLSLTAARSITAPDLLAITLSYAVEALQCVGRIDIAEEVASEVLILIDESSSDWAMMEPLLIITPTLTASGEFVKALEATRRIAKRATDSSDQRSDMPHHISNQEQIKPVGWAELGVLEKALVQVMVPMKELEDKMMTWRLSPANLISPIPEIGRMQWIGSLSDSGIRDNAVSWLAQTTARQQNLGRAAEAAASIRSMIAKSEDEQTSIRAVSLAYIALIYARAGEYNPVWDLNDEIFAVLKKSGADLALISLILKGIAPALALADDLQEALATVNRLLAAVDGDQEKKADEKSNILAEVAMQLAQKGAIEDSLGIAFYIDDQVCKSKVLVGVIEVISKSDELERTFSTLLAIGGIDGALVEKLVPENRKRVFIAVAQAFAELGKFEIAAEVAWKAAPLVFHLGPSEGISDGDLDYASAITSIAREFAKLGQRKRAMHAATYARGLAEKVDSKELLLTQIIEILTGLEMFDSAMEVANEIDDKFANKADALGKLSVFLAATGNFDRAEEVVEMIKNLRIKASALSQIAVVLAKQDEPKRAVETALDALANAAAFRDDDKAKIQTSRKIVMGWEEPQVGSWILSRSVEALYLAGEMNRATELANEATIRSDAIVDELLRSSELSEVASAFARIGEKEKALSLVERALTLVHDTNAPDYRKLRPLRWAAQVLAQLGASNRSVAIASVMADLRVGQLKNVAIEESQKINALLGLAQEIADAGEPECTKEVSQIVLAVIDEMSDRSVKMRSLDRVLKLLLKNGERSRAFQIWRDQLASTQRQGRASVFNVIEAGAPLIAEIDQGQTLYDLYESVVEVERWWSS